MKLVYCMGDCSKGGGTERTISIQANYFAEHGHEVHIINTEIPENKENMFHFSDKIYFHNLNICYNEVDNSISLSKIIKRIRKGAEHERRLNRLLYSLRPDFTIALFGHEMSFLYRLKDGSRKIQQYHFYKRHRTVEFRCNQTSVYKKFFSLLKEWRKRCYIKHYDAFVVLTQEDAEAWGWYPNLHIIPNALSFMPEQASTCLNKQVISVGRLTILKGFNLLIEAWSRVIKMYPGWRLVIFGSGEEERKLQAIIEKYNLCDSIKIFPPTKDISAKYAESSIYAMTSLSEGFPMVLVEAMACGLPCVSFSTSCGPAEIISHEKDGFVVPLGNIRELSEKLSLLMSDEDLRIRMGKAARQNISRYSVDQVMEKWKDLFRQLSI